MSKSKTPFSVSLFTSEQPETLSKSFRLDAAGQLEKTTGGALARGKVVTINLDSISDFADLLSMMSTSQALAYGLSPYKKATVLSKKKMETYTGEDAVISRTQDYFTYPASPGILMLDYDPPKDKKPLSKQELLERLYSICEEIKHAPHVVAASASSFIYNGDLQLKGESGWRVFVLVSDAKDIPRAGKTLFKRSWIKGHGYIKISTAGSMLSRSLIDDAVFQPERLDFVAGAACVKPLTQKRPAPEVFNPEAPPMETSTALPSLSQKEKKQFEAAVHKAKIRVESKAGEVRKQWIVQRTNQVFLALPIEEQTDERRTTLLAEFNSAISCEYLNASFILQTEDGDLVTVEQLLDNPSQWHGQRFADPLEPTYHNDNRIAWANLKAYREPYIYSHAHGGRLFKLRNKTTLRIVEGQRATLIDDALTALNHAGVIFDRGGELVQVGVKGDIIPLTPDGVQLILDRCISWERYKERKQKWTACNVPPDVAKGIIAAKDRWPFPPLKSVVTAPTLNPTTGELTTEEGYDEDLEMLLLKLNKEEWPTIQSSPDQNQLKEAIDTLWTPFKDFPFSDVLDRSVMICAILTAAIRPCLPTAPGFIIDAPLAGSGKTLLARCLARLSGAQTPSEIPVTQDKEEFKKRLLPIGRNGEFAMVFDNITHPLDSAVLALWLTSTTYSDRVLQTSTSVNVPTRSLCLLTGNNLQVRGDLCRRLLRIRINPATEYPMMREFDLDPYEYCNTNRLKMVCAALTVLRFGLKSQIMKKGRIASYELWSDVVRNAVMSVSEAKVMELVDPALSIIKHYKEDDETNLLKTFITAWYDLFEENEITVAQAHSDLLSKLNIPQNSREALLVAFTEISKADGEVNTQKVGTWMRANKERICSGYWIIDVGLKNGSRIWRVEKAVQEGDKGANQ